MLRGKDPIWWILPGSGHPRADALPLTRGAQSGRAAGHQERQLQDGRLDRRGYCRAKMAAVSRAVVRQDRENRMMNKTKNSLSPVAGQPGLSPVRVKLRRVHANLATAYPPDGDSKVWWNRLKKALGTRSSDFLNVSLIQLKAAAQLLGSGISEPTLNAALAMIEAAGPKDEIEGAHAVQMACTHMAVMAVLVRLGGGHGTERRVAALGSAAARLLRAYSTQVEVLRRLRHGGHQYVRVEHVHVNDGGQAVIGNVNTPKPPG